MSDISHYPAVQEINFYLNEASADLIEIRRIYLSNFLLPTWKRRLEEARTWKERTATDNSLIAKYESGVALLSEALKQECTV